MKFPIPRPSLSNIVFSAILFVILLSSCATKEEIVYFQGIEQLYGTDAPKMEEVEIEVNDVLRIDVSSLNDELVKPFEMDYGNQSSSGGGSGTSNAALQGYLVEVDGNITFPVLGEIQVLNKTKSELEKYLTKELREYIKDAVVRVRIVNFKITVMGETGSSVLEVPDERISVPQAIAMAGDITYDGKRENVLVVRMQDGKMTYGRLDLTSADIFKDPFYYLQQNDILYVEPTYRKVKSAGFITSWQGLVSIVTTAFSLFVLFNR